MHPLLSHLWLAIRQRLSTRHRPGSSATFLRSTRLHLAGLLLLLVGCQQALRPGESRLLRVVGDANLRTEAGPGVFVGVSHPCADEAEARRDAELQARQAIIASLQSQVESEVLQLVRLDGQPSEILTTSVEQQAQVRALSRNLISVQVESWYLETRERAQDDYLRTEVQAWCRMRYTPEQHQRLLEELLTVLGPPLEEGARAAALAFAGSRLEDGLRLAAQAGRQLESLDRYQGWTPAQQGRLGALRQSVEAAWAPVTIYVDLEAQVDGQPVSCGLGPAVARALRGILPVVVQEGRPPTGVGAGSGVLLSGILQLKTRTVTGGLVSCAGQLESTLSHVAGGEILWRCVEPGQFLKDLREGGGNAEWASRRLLEGPLVLEALPEALASGLRARLLKSL